MREWADFTIETAGDGTQTIAFAGPLVVSSVGTIDARLRALGAEVAKVDLAGVSDIDTVGAWLVWRVAHETDAAITGASEKASRLISAVEDKNPDSDEAGEDELTTSEEVLGGVGGYVMSYAHGVIELLGFTGALVVAGAKVIRRPGTMRWTSLFRQIDLGGVGALPIVGLMSFLIGIVIAQQGAVQLQQFGAEIYTVNLTGRLSMRELGPLMTAIMFAGRSGSSFAAQIGTMKLTEEVDAMRTIGVSPVQALILPRILAAVIIMPLLGFYASLMAIVGGAFVSMFSLEIPFFTFLTRIREVVPMHDLWVGLFKGPVFGLIVALAGCYQGMRVRGNSEEVGLKTTIAVVQAIFAVIVLDAFFAVFFTEIGWG